MSVAERLYYTEQDRLEFVAAVTDIRLESRAGGSSRWQVALDRTAFYPESGGQPWDVGTLEAVARSGARLEVPVLAVVEEEGEIWHVVEKPLTAGTEVRGRVDERLRLDHMQQHTGQHLLSAVFLRELNASTISFHLGTESSTIDLSVPSLTAAEILRVEEATNILIREDRPVSATILPAAQAAEMLARGDLRKLPERVGAIRVIEIEGIEWNACGGTHVASTGRIGGLTIRKVERMKQGMRLEFCCGLRAVRTARRDFETLGEVGRLLSTGSSDLPEKVAAMLEDAKAADKARMALLEDLAAMEARTLSGAGRIVAVHARSVTYAKLLAAKLALQGNIALIATVEDARGTVVLSAASGVECGVVMKESLAVLGARGGGSSGLAQGGVAADQLPQLLELLRARIAL